MVPKFMGHGRVETTMRYLHTMNADDLPAVQKLPPPGTPTPGTALAKKERRTA
jgi:hypothetical protein